MDASIISTIRDWSIATLAVMALSFILYFFIRNAFRVLGNMQAEHQKDQDWFKEFVNENNHQKTELITRVSENIAQNTTVTEMHTKTLERLIDRLGK